MSEQSAHKPYQMLGIQLKRIRQKLQESLAEVSGAVEIDTNELESFEYGTERPNEDLLMLLISHFGMRDDEAVTLWELAGYDRAWHAQNAMHEEGMSKQQLPVVVMLSLDTRILYSDGVNITANPSGIVANFTQNAGADSQRVAVARIGMSREQAQNVVKVLSHALTHMDHVPKALPEPKPTKKKTGNN